MDKRIASVIAVIMGIVALLMIKTYVSKTTKQARKGLDLISIVVASKNLNEGEKITETNTGKRKFPVKYVGKRAIRVNNYSLILGQKLQNTVEKGKPVLWSDLDIGKSSGFASMIKPGMRTVTIPVSSLTSVSNMIKPGSRIDIFLTFNKSKIETEEKKNNVNKGEIPNAKDIQAFREYLIRKYSEQSKSKQITTLLKQNVMVLAVGKNHLHSSTSSDEKASYSEITLLTTLLEAQEIIHAMTMGKMTLTLRNDSDVEKQVVPPTTDRTVFYSAISESIAKTENKKD